MFQFRLTTLLLLFALVGGLLAMGNWLLVGGHKWTSISGLAYSPDGKTLAVTAYSGRTVQETMRMATKDGRRMVLSISLDRYATSELFREDYANGRLRLVPWGQTLAYSPDGRQLLVCHPMRGRIERWDTRTGDRMDDLDVPVEGGISLTRDGNQVLIGASNSESVWDLRTDQISTTSRPTYVPSIAGEYRPPTGSSDYDEPLIALLGSAVASVDRLASFLASKGLHQGPITYSKDGKRAAVAASKGLYIVDLPSKSAKRLSREQVEDVDISPEGRFVAAAGDSGVTLWDLSAPREAIRISDSERVRCVAFAPDGSHLATGDHRGMVEIWNVGRREKIASIDFHRPHNVSFLLVGVTVVCSGLILLVFISLNSPHSQNNRQPPSAESARLP